MERIESNSITIFTSTSAISMVSEIWVSTLRRLKKFSRSSKRSMMAPWVAPESFAAYKILALDVESTKRDSENTHPQEDTNSSKDHFCKREYLQN